MNENRSFKPQNLDLFLEEEELILRKKNDEIVIKESRNWNDWHRVKRFLKGWKWKVQRILIWQKMK